MPEKHSTTQRSRCPQGGSMVILRALIAAPKDACILWPFALSNGYGVSRNITRRAYAHVLSWELSNGKLSPDDGYIRHTCGARSCINPKHLFLELRWCPQDKGIKLIRDFIAADTDECLLWPYHNNKGYGSIKFKGRNYFTHVLAWMLANDRSVPDGLCVMHSCDIRNCCNPRHLSLGTHQDNSDDMVRKHRQMCGERHVAAKITVDQVRAIRSMSTVSCSKAAIMFGLTKAAISKIRTRRTWKSVE